MSGKASPSGIIPLTNFGGLGDPFGALTRADKALKDKKTGKSVTDRALTAARDPKVGQAEKVARDQYINNLGKKYKAQGVMTEGDFYAARLFGDSKRVTQGARSRVPQLHYGPGAEPYAKRAISTPVRAAGKPHKVAGLHPKSCPPVGTSLSPLVIRDIRRPPTDGSK